MQRIKPIAMTMIVGLAAIGLMITSAQSAILNVTDGQLIGAQNVTVAGIGAFNVKFLDGTCADLFSGCDELSDFTFTNETDARAAVSALFEQVFIDTPFGLFDSNPELTAGCTSRSLCVAIFPFQVPAFNTSNIAGAANRVPGATNEDNFFSSPLDPDIFSGPTRTFAVFTPQSVLEPATLALFSIGLGGLALARRHRKAA